MAEFKAFVPGVEVNGETVLSIVNAMKGFEGLAIEILKNNGIDHPKPRKWYMQQSWLDAFKEISDKMGAETLLNIGKAIPENAQFPPGIDNLEKGLNLIDVAYHMNHRGGEIGYYKLVEYNEYKKHAVMECKNPYPSHFDRGIITCFVSRFKASDHFSVELDKSKPTRLKGADSCTYIIRW
jgi:hypothetical protein